MRIAILISGLLCLSLEACESLKTGDVPPGRYDRTADLIDKTLYIEYVSKDYRGNWIGIQASNYQAYNHPVPEQYVYHNQFIRIQALDCGEGTICLRNRWTEFDEADKNLWYLKTKATNADTTFEGNPAPQYYNDYKWKVYCTSDTNFDACYICDITYTAVQSEWICLYGQSNHYIRGGPLSTQDHNWRIVVHNAVDNGYTENHFDLCNDLEAAIYMEYQYCVGIQVPLYSGWSVTPSMASEIRDAVILDILQTGSSTHKSDWANEIQHLQTFSQENCTSVELPVPPHTAVTVEQLTASYGPFLVKSQKLNIMEKDYSTCNL